MMRARSLAAVLFLAAASSSVALAQVITENGINYQITKQSVPSVVTETRMEQRTVTSYQNRYTTDFQEVQRTYRVPITEQQWVPGYEKSWNPFAPPVLSYRMVPVTRWELRQETVRVPVTKHEVVPQEHVVQVPITTQHVATNEITHKRAIGVAGETNVASNPGSQRMPSDPPRQAWRGVDNPNPSR